ncbi:hypothetical protein D5R81_00450 [Parashewanella spongiae]|uniref:Uncharacterized protein n=1 Tax=Parashewanella spongiae TaxID=342950 RepID=A0A3A6TTA4_9GAMM|nr:hypothetical protein D5R81_00450 [Parashewanella spongiae]
MIVCQPELIVVYNSLCLLTAFTECVKRLCTIDEHIIPLDGKTLRRTLDKMNEVQAIHTADIEHTY